MVAKLFQLVVDAEFVPQSIGTYSRPEAMDEDELPQLYAHETLEDEVNTSVREASLNATPRFPEVEEAVVATGAAEEVVVGTTIVARVVAAADVVGIIGAAVVVGTTTGVVDEVVGSGVVEVDEVVGAAC